LQTKVTDLSRSNNDMNNLLAGTGIGTVFVDHRLRILRFTPAATRIISLILSDIGRPIGHFVSNLVGYDRLLADTQAVLDTLAPREVEVQTRDGKWYTLRIQPYRTIENVIEGAVITFVDVTDMKRTETALRRSEKLLRLTQKLSRIGGWEWDLERKTMYWTEETYQIHDLLPDQAASLSQDQLERSLACYRPEDRPVVQAAFQTCAEEGVPYDLEVPFTSAKGRSLRVRLSAEATVEDGKIKRVLGFIMDITDQKA